MLIFLLASAVLGSFGNWTVERNIDPMTDKVSCIARYKGKPDVQLTVTDLYIGVRANGGGQSVRFRFDSKPAGEMRLLFGSERNIAVSLHKEEWEEFLASKRLRFQIYTQLETLYEGDLDLSGHLKAMEAMRTVKCGYEPP